MSIHIYYTIYIYISVCVGIGCLMTEFLFQGNEDLGLFRGSPLPSAVLEIEILWEDLLRTLGNWENE